MDFTFSSDQDAAADLAQQVLRGRQPGPTGDGFDRDLWGRLTEAGLLSLHLPEPVGDGIGMIAACRVLVELGRSATDLPVAAHVAATALLGDRANEVAGPLSIALGEGVDPAPELPLTTTCHRSGTWILDGTKTMVPPGEAFLVSVGTYAGPAVFLVLSSDEGVEVIIQESSGGHRVAELRLRNVALPADRRIGGTESVVRLRQGLALTTAAVQFGLCERALELTAEHTATREQFGKPLGSLQAVRQRLGDGYIDLACLRLAMWQAAWRWEAGETLSPAVDVAAYWTAEAGYRISRSAVHLHGGAGVDLDGQVHHYFTAATRNEMSLGGVTRQALAIGRHFADA